MKTKTFIFLTIISIFAACKKDNSEPPAKSTYRIVNNVEYVSSADSYLNGSMYEIIVFCYKGADIARQDNIDMVQYGGGKSDMIEVNSDYDKVKVSFKFLPKVSPNYDLTSNARQYVVSAFFIEKGKNIDITIDGSTMISTTLKSSGMALNKAIKNIKP